MNPSWMIPSDQLAAFEQACQGNPFAWLGRHRVNGELGVRAWLPGAVSVAVLDAEGRRLGALTRQGNSALFAAAVPGLDTLAPYRLQVDWGGHAGEHDDPYRFEPLITDSDVWLLAEGTHRRPYEWLGAHPQIHQGVGGTRFAVWAPNARSVSVVGSFNGWNAQRHPMRKRHECGVWELFVPQVGEGDLYKFDLLGADGHRHIKADPFAFRSELRPQTASVVQRLLPGLGPDPQRQVANRLDAPISIYEVHPGSWRRHADGSWLSWAELAAELIPYAVSMGFSHLELLPVQEHPFDGSWGYQPTGLYAPTARFGTPQDLRDFIAAAHAAGLGVLADWVPAHFPSDAHGLAEFDGTHLYEHADPKEGFHPDWNTLIYNFGRHEVRNFLVANALYWIERFGLDGLRVDAVASMLYRDYSRRHGEWVPNRHGGRENLEAIDFLRRANHRVGVERPGALMIAEESTSFPLVSRPPTPDLKAGGLGFHFKWNMGWMNDTLAYMALDPLHRRYHHDRIRFSLMYAFSENFILPISHDEVVHGKGSMLGKMPGDRWQRFANLRAFYGWMWGHPGKKLLFMGCEFGQQREWNADAGLDWGHLDDPMHAGLQRWVRDLNVALRELPALHQLDTDPAGFAWISHDQADLSLLAFERRDRSGRSVMVICNFTPVPRLRCRLGVPQPGVWAVRLNSDAEVYGGSGVGGQRYESEAQPWDGRLQSLQVDVPPLGMLLLVPVSVPDAGGRIDEPSTREVSGP